MHFLVACSVPSVQDDGELVNRLRVHGSVSNFCVGDGRGCLHRPPITYPLITCPLDKVRVAAARPLLITDGAAPRLNARNKLLVSFFNGNWLARLSRAHQFPSV